MVKQYNSFKMKVIFFVISLAFSIVVNAQNTIYVATGGDDISGNGTIEKPYASVQYALNNTSDNDTVVLRNGTYISEEIVINNNNITIKSYPDEWAIIQAVTNIPDVTSCIWYHEPTIVGGRLERLEIIGGYLYGVKLESDWNWGAPIPERNGTSNIVISQCIIHDTGRDCLKMPSGCDNITVENCHIYNSGIGVSNNPNDPNAEGIDMVNNDNVIIRNCYVHNTSTSGIYSKGGSKNVLIENNLVINTGESGILLGFYTDEEWFDTIANPNFYENINGTVKNNIIVNTGLDGIGMYAAYQPKVYNNTVIDAARNNHAALFFNTGYMWLDAINGMIAPPTVDVYVVNNIFIASDNNTNRPNAQIRYYDGDTTSNMLGNCVVNNNLYYKNGGAKFDDGIDWQMLSLTDWQNSTGFDASTIETNPLLDTTYHLTATSSCINAGLNIPELGFDYDGNARLLPFDIGADEYNAGINLRIPPVDNTIGTGNNSDKETTVMLNFDIDLKIYPNPANNYINITTINNREIKLVEIIDLSGKVIKRVNVENTTSGINISDLEVGVYVISVQVGSDDNKRLFIKSNY